MSRSSAFSSVGWLSPSIIEIQSKQWQLVMKTAVLTCTFSGLDAKTTIPKKWSKKKRLPPPFVSAELSFEFLGFMYMLPSSAEVEQGLASPFFTGFLQAAVFFEDGTCCFINTTQLQLMWKSFSNRTVYNEEEALRPEDQRGQQQFGRQRSFRDLGTYIPTSRALLEHVVEHGSADVVCLAQLRLLEIQEQQGPVHKSKKTSLAWGLGSEREVILLSLDDWKKIFSLLFS